MAFRQGAPPAGGARLRELDLLRFLAAFAVLLFHFTGFGGQGAWPEPAREMFPSAVGDITAYGYLGVDLFFMISGFVILMSAWGRGVGEFGVSRLVRLMPAYWAAVLLGAVLFAVFGTGSGTVYRVIPNFTMLQAGLGVKNVDPAFWTLWVELHFYVLIAALGAIGITYKSAVAFMGGWLFLGLYANEADHNLLQSLLVPSWAPYFIGGMALFMIYRFGSTLLLWGFVGVAWLLSLHYGAWRAGTMFKGVSDKAVIIAITGIYVLMILVALRKLTWLRWKRLTVLGALTYPVYLIHQQVALPLVERIYPQMQLWAALGVLIVTCLVLAYLIQRFVEQPVAAWMKPRLRESLARMRLADGPPPASAASAPASHVRAASPAEAAEAAGPAGPADVEPRASAAGRTDEASAEAEKLPVEQSSQFARQ